MSDLLTDLRLNTINGLCAAITKMMGDYKKGDKPDSIMLAVFESVLEQIEFNGGYDADIARTTAKVRALIGIPKAPKKEGTSDEATNL
jgi:hypothetical protein